MPRKENAMKMGRPMEFDPEVALAKAMSVFWSQGYESTSTTDLMSAMGLSKSSLYQTFGSKRQLFLQSLEHYCQQATERQRTVLAGAKPDKQFLIDLFHRLIKPDRTKPPGCLLVNTACEFGGTDSELSSLVKSRLDGTRQLFQTAIEQAQSTGEIPKDKDARTLSEFLVTSVVGLRVMLKLKTKRSTLKPTVDHILAQLD